MRINKEDLNRERFVYKGESKFSTAQKSISKLACVNDSGAYSKGNVTELSAEKKTS